MSKKELDTEQKIKEAARKIFQQKGFSGTKTRDIAEASGINLALMNYYFRSKKKLFDEIMLETLQSFFSGVIKVLNNEETTIKEKINKFVEHYIDLLSENPNVANFILESVRENPEEYVSKIGLLEGAKGSVFIKQFQEAMMKGEIPPINPMHLMMNLMGLVVFPFIAQPLVTTALGMPNDMFLDVIQERKRLIPLWVEAMLKVT